MATPYRDERRALEERQAELTQRLSVLEARASEMTALEKELVVLRAELHELEQKLQKTPARRRLPTLDNLHIASPCNASWDAMTGDERTRHCAQCDKNVFNLSEMTRDEAEALIAEKEGKLCVRYYLRADGTILTADCPVGVCATRRRRNLMIAAGAGIVAGAATLFGLQAQGSRCTQTQVMMGSVTAGPVHAAQPMVQVPTQPAQRPEPVMMGDIAEEPPSVAPPAHQRRSSR